jgi:ankyrin repeat protein
MTTVTNISSGTSELWKQECKRHFLFSVMPMFESRVDHHRINERQFMLAVINICKDHPMTLILGMKSFLPPSLTVNILGPDDYKEEVPTIKMFSWSNTLKSAVTFGIIMTDGSALQVRIEPDERRMEQFTRDEEEEGEDDHGPFPQAIIDNDATTVRAFIESGINLEKRYGKVHKTALMIAAGYNQHEIVNILVKEGANLYSRDDNGEIGLFWAAWNGCVESLRILHLAGCDLDDRDTRAAHLHEGLSTAMYKAAANGEYESVRYLVDSGANIMCPNNFGTPPHTKASAQGHSNILNYLLNHGARLDHRNAAGVTALHMAAQWGEMGCLDVCLDHNANVEVEDRNGWTPLFCACWKGQYPCVRWLVERGHANLSHISHRDKCGPLIISILSNNVETVAYLIDEAHCDIAEIDGDGDNILHCVGAFGADQLLDYLFEKHREDVQRLLESLNNDCQTPEQKARHEQQQETAELLASYSGSA